MDWAEPNGVGFSHVVGIGGNADLGFRPVLDWLSRDPGTGAILLDHAPHQEPQRVPLRRPRRRAPAPGGGDPGRRPARGSRPAWPTRSWNAALRRGRRAQRRKPGSLAGRRRDPHPRPPGAPRGGGDRHQCARPRRGWRPTRCCAAASSWLAERGDPRRTVAAARRAAAAPPVCSMPAPRRRSGSPKLPPCCRTRPEVGGVLVVLAPTGPRDDAAVEALIACAAHRPGAAAGLRHGRDHRRRPPPRASRRPGCRCSPPRSRRCAASSTWCRDRRNRAAARELPPRRRAAIWRPTAARSRRLFAAGACSRPADPDAGRGAGGAGRLWHPGGADPRAPWGPMMPSPPPNCWLTRWS